MNSRIRLQLGRERLSQGLKTLVRPKISANIYSINRIRSMTIILRQDSVIISTIILISMDHVTG